MKVEIYFPQLRNRMTGTVYYDRVFQFDVDDVVTVDEVFHVLNCYPFHDGLPVEVWNDPDVIQPEHPLFEKVKEYRNMRRRSLSVGDLVSLNEHVLECQPFGWAPVVALPSNDRQTLEI